MTTTYYGEKVVRETVKGAKFYSYSYAENFGRDTAYARSWGNRERSGRGFIWAKPGESFDDAIARRCAQYAE